jgi:hypothetical protein
MIEYNFTERNKKEKTGREPTLREVDTYLIKVAKKLNKKN